jgi:hypothetical protein
MDRAEQLRLAGEQILADAQGFCDRAQDTLDDLEAWGKEPSLEADWLSGFVDEPYYFTAGKMVSEAVLPALPRQGRARFPWKASPSQPFDRESPNTFADVSEVLGIAHPEDPQAWQNAIAAAMAAQSQPVGFWALAEATGLASGELLLGLLMGGWTLSQEEFYGEILIWSPRVTPNLNAGRKTVLAAG